MSSILLPKAGQTSAWLLSVELLTQVQGWHATEVAPEFPEGGGDEHGLWRHVAWLGPLAVPLTSWVTMGRSFDPLSLGLSSVRTLSRSLGHRPLILVERAEPHSAAALRVLS